MFERVKNVIKAAGHKATCDGNCSCHSVRDELGNIRPGVEEEVGEFVDYDFSQCSPELQECIENMLNPEGLKKLQEEIDRQNKGECDCESTPSVGDPTTPDRPCIHMEVIFKCHVGEGDMKPTNCSLSTCPARAQAHMREQMKEQQNAHMFN